MPIKADPHYVGRAWITPDGPVVAGQLGTWTVTYEVGGYGYDERARLKIAWRFASDWGTPQFKDPHGRNYTTVRLETVCPTAVADLSVEQRGQVRPWFKTLVVAVADGSLSPGDRIHVTIGDTSGGGDGSRAQTFREKRCEWRIFVDPFGTELYTTLAASPVFDVVGGAVVVTAAAAVVGGALSLLLNSIVFLVDSQKIRPPSASVNTVSTATIFPPPPDPRCGATGSTGSGTS